MLKILFVAGAAALLAQPAAAANWIRLGDQDDGTVIYVDDGSIVQSGDFERGWVKFDFSKSKAEMARTEFMFVKINCAEKVAAALERVRYAPSGEVIFNRKWPDIPSSYNNIVPDSVADNVFSYFCRTSIPEGAQVIDGNSM